MHKRILISLIIVIFCGCSSLKENKTPEVADNLDNYHAAKAYYNSLIGSDTPRIAELNLFFSLMPKGGDIHHHYSGAIYAETYLDWVDKKGYWINRSSLKIDKEQSIDSVTVSELRKDDQLYRELLKKWSDKDYNNHFHLQAPPDAQFFDTFGYFAPISSGNFSEGLQMLKLRAIQENVQYIETMFKSTGYSREDRHFDGEMERLRADADAAGLVNVFLEYMDVMDKDENFRKQVKDYIESVKTSHSGIDDDMFTMRFQSYVSRNSKPSVVFSSLYAAFAAADQSDLIVGVNILGPENGIVAMADYVLHMQMFKFMRSRFPDVHVAMHAGELTLGMVTPEGLTHHIRDAVEIAGAERVGHGVDIVYEKAPLELIQEMRAKNIAVEINLTSNDFILGVKGEAHPVTIYSRYGVPVVISTDDAGVSRNTLSSEYVLLASRYRFSYDDIKRSVYNSIQYSFMNKEDKEKNRKMLDDRYLKFETDMAKFTERMDRGFIRH